MIEEGHRSKAKDWGNYTVKEVTATGFEPPIRFEMKS